VKFAGMEKYVRTKSARWICIVCFLKFVFSLAMTVSVGIRYGRIFGESVFGDFVTEMGSLAFVSLFAYLIEWIIFQCFYSTGKGGWLIRIGHLFCFLACAVGVIGWIGTIIDACSKVDNKALQDFDQIAAQYTAIKNIASETIGQVIIAGIIAGVVIAAVALYFLSVYKTFRHIRSEIQAGQMLELKKPYRLPFFATIMVVLNAVSVLAIIGLFLEPDYFNVVLPKALVSRISTNITVLFQQDNLFAIYISAMTVLSFLESIFVLNCAKKFREVHRGIPNAVLEKPVPARQND